MLDIDELDALEETLQKEMPDRWLEVLSRLNRSGELEKLLDLLGMADILKQEQDELNGRLRNGTIVVLGGSEVKEKDLLAIGKGMGLSKDRFEFCLDYYGTKKFNYRKLQWQPNYSLVMVGPMPHSTAGKDNYGSSVSAMENEAGYPPVVRLGKTELKISKTDFREKLEQALNAGTIVA